MITSVDPRQLQQIAADVNQLTKPIHVAVGQRVVTHPPLLDQLRDAITPGAVHYGPQRHTPPSSRPAANLAALDALATIYVEVAGWHARQNMPSPPRDTDWQKTALRQLVGLAPILAPAIADWLAADVNTWWRLAGVHTGWRTQELLRVR